MNRKCRDDRGFLSLKTGLMTAGAFLATASMGTAILVGLPAAQSTNVFTDDKSGFCVTATLENDDSYFAQRGNCGTEETPEPEPLPEVPEPTPEPTPTPPIIIETPQIMTTTWDTSLAPNCETITLPISGAVDTQIQWTYGSNQEKFNTNNPSHSFTAPYGPAEITINGTFENWGATVNGWADANCLVSVNRWEGTETKNLSYAFSASTSLKHVEEIPSTTMNLQNSFAEITRNFTLGNLQTSNVVSMKSMFHNSTYFNNPINFDTSKVKDMSFMFSNAEVFNQPLNFKTENVIKMNSMFLASRKFDQPLTFDTSNVDNMASMFNGANSLNQPLDFNTSKVTDMELMFWGNINKFNQDLSKWDVSKVTKKNNFMNSSIWTLPKPKF